MCENQLKPGGRPTTTPPQMAHEKMDLLDQCSDMVLHCSDGRDIPCIRFYCVSTCEAIRNVCEDVELPRDGRGRLVVPFPNVDSTDLALAMEYVHGIRGLSSLCAGTCTAVLRGLRALGLKHAAMNEQLMRHLWTLVRGSRIDCVMHADDLLHTEAIQTEVLRALVVSFPTWAEFSTKVLGAVSMDAPLATALLRTLCKFFPAGPVFHSLLDAIPAKVLTVRAAMRIFTESKAAMYFHPAEALDMASALTHKFAGDTDDEALELLRGVLTASCVYDMAPHSANALHGSVIMLEHTPMGSMLLTITDKKGYAGRRMAPWATVNVDWSTGAVDLRLTLARLDDGGSSARRCQVRMVAYSKAGSAELWYDVRDVNPHYGFSVMNEGVYAAGDADGFVDVMRGPLVTRLRIDVFYAGHSVLEKCFF